MRPLPLWTARDWEQELLDIEDQRENEDQSDTDEDAYYVAESMCAFSRTFPGAAEVMHRMATGSSHPPVLGTRQVLRRVGQTAMFDGNPDPDEIAWGQRELRADMGEVLERALKGIRTSKQIWGSSWPNGADQCRRSSKGVEVA